MNPLGSFWPLAELIACHCASGTNNEKAHRNINSQSLTHSRSPHKSVANEVSSNGEATLNDWLLFFRLVSCFLSLWIHIVACRSKKCYTPLTKSVLHKQSHLSFVSCKGVFIPMGCLLKVRSLFNRLQSVWHCNAFCLHDQASVKKKAKRWTIVQQKSDSWGHTAR